MIKKQSTLLKHAIVVAFVSFLGLSQGAIAAPCNAEIDAIKTALNDGVCQNRRNCRGLNNKLDRVNRKLEKGKYRKAARKLADFGAVVAHIEKRASRKPHRRARLDFVSSKYQEMMGLHFNAAVACVNNPDAYVADASDSVTPVNDQPVEEVYGPEEEIY